MVKIGDRVRYTAGDRLDLINGCTYEVVIVNRDNVIVFDEIGEHNELDNYEWSLEDVKQPIDNYLIF